MPKTSFLQRKNKKTISAGGDFKRLKAKVGKRAVKPASHTDTSFQSKRVRVTAQSILSERGPDVVGTRGHAVGELLVQLKHYSPSVKRDALIGLTTVVEHHPGYAEKHFTSLVEPSLEAVLSQDGHVRQAFLAYQGVLLRAVPPSTLAPFADQYVAYAGSAMTSLDELVRRDSLAFLALLLDRFPAGVAVRATRLLPNYVALLKGGPTVKRGAHSAVLTSLSALLAATADVSRGAATKPAGFRPSGAATAAAVAAAEAGQPSGASIVVQKLSKTTEKSGPTLQRDGRQTIRGRILLLRPVRDIGGSNPGASASSFGGAGASAAAAAAAMDLLGADVAATLRAQLPGLLPRLQDLWLEALSHAGAPNAAQLGAVADALLALLSHPAASAEAAHDAATAATVAALWAFCAHFVPLLLESFPVAAAEGAMQGAAALDVATSLAVLNAALCQVVVAAAATARAHAAAAAAGNGGGAGCGGNGSGGSGSGDGCGIGGGGRNNAGPGEVAAAAAARVWLLPVLEHVRAAFFGAATGTAPLNSIAAARLVGVLHSALLDAGRDEAAAPASAAAAAAGASGRLSGATAEVDVAEMNALAAFGRYYASLPSGREGKRVCVGFVCDFSLRVLERSGRRGSGGGGDGSSGGGGGTTAGAAVAWEWLASLPPLLVAWGSSRPDLSGMALHVLLEAAKRGSPLLQSCSDGGNGDDSKSSRSGGSNGNNGGGDSCRSSGGSSGGGCGTGSGGGSTAGADAGSGADAAARELLESLGEGLAPLFDGALFRALPPRLQLQAAAILYHLPALPPALLDALAGLCGDAGWRQERDGVRGLLLEVLHHRRRILTPAAYLNLLVDVLVGTARGSGSSSGDGGGGYGGARSSDGAGVGREAGSSSAGSTARTRKKRQRDGESVSAAELRSEIRPANSAAAAAARAAAGTLPAGPGEDAWQYVFSRDAVAAEVAAVLARAGGKAVAALLPVFAALLLDDEEKEKEVAGHRGCRRLLRNARLVATCLVRCADALSGPGSPDHIGAIGAPLAVAVTTTLSAEAFPSVARRLREPMLALLERWPPLLPVVLTALSSRATAAAADAADATRARPLLEAFLALLRVPELEPGLAAAKAALMAAAAAVAAAWEGQQAVQMLARQIRADAELIAAAEGSAPGG